MKKGMVKLMLRIVAWTLCAAAGLFLLYLFAISPRIFGRPKNLSIFASTKFAHRGLHDDGTYAPENSMKAFELAMQAGYGIEMDIQLTKDKRLIVFHDDDFDRVARREDGTAVPGAVKNYTLEEIRGFHLFGTEQRIPTLEEFLALVDGKTPILLEYKTAGNDPEICKYADPLLREYKGPLCIQSFDPMVVGWYRKHNPGMVRGQLATQFNKNEPGKYTHIKYTLVANLYLNVVARPDFIAYEVTYADTPSLVLCHKLFGAPAFAWTVNTQEKLEMAQKKFDTVIFEDIRP